MVEYDYELVQVWAREMEQGRLGRTVESEGLWIAATGGHRNVPLLSHETDFANWYMDGLRVIRRIEHVP
ncbi:MAG: hypothetical protein KatS3mg110_2735 [Pirellulaceae bacterium]|nr:MAG: hypothetical protein KatS3mg110_2735 [Pirellulaceae bacterium]